MTAIIAGMAILTGINLFYGSAKEANQDAVIQDLMTIAARSQIWYKRPKMLGGGGGSFATCTLTKLQFDSVNANGSYSLAASDGMLIITGQGTEGDKYVMQVFPDSIGMPTKQ